MPRQPINVPDVTHAMMANAIRALSMDAVERANCGHPGLPMGMADVATVLWRDFLLLDPAHPHWPNRDRFVLSAGHGSLLLYTLGYLTGYNALTIDDLKNFRQLHSRTPGHPERDAALGIETTTGPLGQGFANAVGMALAERLLNARYGDALYDHFTYVIASDGDMQEGINHEAAALAGHLKLSRLVVLYDDNGVTIDGPAHLSMSDDVAKRYESYGWVTRRIDGHNEDEITDALDWAKDRADEPNAAPVLILCRTTIGYGAPHKAGTSAVHGNPLGADEIAAARATLHWPYAPFDIPAPVKQAWESVFPKARVKYGKWLANFLQLDEDTQKAFTTANQGAVPTAAIEALAALKEKFYLDKPTQATRVSSGAAVNALAPHLPNLIGGSADLTPSTNTRARDMQAIAPGDFSGNYIHWGIREHGMAAAMNGIALHGGLIPYGGTFLCFSDYCRPAIRLAALMQLRVVFVMTHDSIGLGEDGPTHQPVEHLAALRAIPGLNVLRPADAVETAECWQIALYSHSPTLLALSRQNLRTLRHRIMHESADLNRSARGAYVLRDNAGATVTLIATGSEVELAMDTADILEKNGHPARIVSMPSMELFARQTPDYQQQVLGANTIQVGIEAGVRLGWDRWIGADSPFFGVTTFGVSAPAADAYAHFGLTPENIAAKITAVLG